MSKCWCGRDLNTAGICPVHHSGTVTTSTVETFIDAERRIEELEAENKRLLEALEPFVVAWREANNSYMREYHRFFDTDKTSNVHSYAAARTTPDDFERARKALEVE